MNILVAQAVLDVFDYYGEKIRYDYERFEEALNDHVPDGLDECYLIVQGFKTGVYDALVIDESIERGGYIHYLQQALSCSKRDAVFLLGVFEAVLSALSYFFEIPEIEGLISKAYEENDYDQLAIIAKTYFLGFGVAQDYEKAFQIYQYLYENDHFQGAYYLGYMYEHGYGVEQEIEKALIYYQSHQSDLADYRLGIIYMFGKYVETDLGKAYMYLSRSQHKDAYWYKGLLLENQKDYGGAFQAYYAGAKLFQTNCLYKAAWCLKTGYGVDVDFEKAYQYFEYGYFFWHGESAFEMAMFYFDQIGNYQGEDQGLHYLLQAADMKSRNACLLLGQLYENGKYVKKDHQKSIAYYQKAQLCEDLTI